MDPSTILRQTVADFFQVDEGQVGPAFSLASRQGSIARAALDAAIRRRVGAKSPAVYSARTFAELAAGLGLGTDGASTVPVISLPSTAAAAPAARPSAAAAGASCGVDIEMVANLPAASDPWEDEFYRANFAPAEIAHCLRQPEPGPSFAARWCAKEALRKCDPAFLRVEGRDIEVAVDPAGAPSLVHHAIGGPSRLPHAVSLSHAGDAAVAMVVRVDAAPPVSDAPVLVPPASPGPAPVVPTPEPRGSATPRWLLVFNLLTLALAALALARTWPGLRWPF